MMEALHAQHVYLVACTGQLSYEFVSIGVHPCQAHIFLGRHWLQCVPVFQS